MSEYCGWCGAPLEVSRELVSEDEPGGPLRICLSCDDEPRDAA